jgi:WD40 repeat protein
VTSHQLTGPLSDPGGGNGVTGLTFSPENADSLAVGDQNGVDSWNLATRNPCTDPDPDDQWIEDVAYSNDGKTIAGVDGAGYVYLLNPRQGQWSSKTFNDPAIADSDSIFASQLASSATGELAVADSHGNVHAWKLPGGAPTVLHGATTAVGNPAQNLAFSPGGKRLP